MKYLNNLFNRINSMMIVSCIILFSSCDVLDVEADNSLSGNILTNEANIQSALSGAYVNLMGIYDGADGGELLGGDFQLMATLLTRANNSEISWDEVKAPDYEDFIDKDIFAVNGRVEANWRRAYETLNTVNAILENIDNVSGSSRDQVQGEALAIRGIIYFELARYWAPQYIQSNASSTLAIPLILESIGSVQSIKIPTKATLAAVYTQVINDLEDASDLLQGVNTPNRISYFSCQAYLARVALQQNDFSTAEGYLNTVISGGFTLTTNPMDAFNNNANSTEDILAVQQSEISNTGTLASRTGLVAHSASIPDAGFAAMRILPSSLNSSFLPNSPKYSAIDKRSVTFTGVTSSSTSSSVPSNAAYYNDPINTLTISSAKYIDATHVIPVVRLAEMHLSRAEAILEQNFISPVTGTPLNDLNLVRVRAGLPALLDTLTADEFYDSLIVERNRELLYEGILFHDLKRWAVFNRRFVNIVGQDPLADRFILPIPQSECDASPGLCQ